MELGRFDKHFAKNIRKKHGNNMESFLLHTLRTYILNGKFNPKTDIIKVFYSKIKELFWFSTKSRGGLALTHSSALVSVSESASVSLSITKYI